MKSKRVQNWDESIEVGKRAVNDVTKFLYSDFVKENWLATELVHNVEDQKVYQKFDIDLLWVVPVNSFLRCYTIEVKGDRQHKFGNFFFETVSDLQQNKPGAFVVSQAEWLFYYFIDIAELYCLPMGVTKAWFLENESRFQEATSHSKRGGNSWSTIGRKVPIKTLMSEVSGVKKFCRKEQSWVEES